ncbi:MAG: AAA domain-containing protein [Candidatus Kryptoniota bacterium]
MNEELEKRIGLFITALQNEIEAQKKFASHSYILKEGHKVGITETGFLYEFTIEEDLRSLEDVPVEVETTDEVTMGFVVGVEGDRVVLLLESFIGDVAELVKMRAAAYFLLEELIERLQEKSGEDLPVAVSVFYPDTDVHVSPDISSFSLSIKSGIANEYQISAVKAVCSQKVTFVWGPPGTGKTETLAYAAANLVANGEKVLILSNTNMAVDVAMYKTLHYLKNEKDYIDGKFLRLGIPRLPEIEEYPWAIPSYVGRNKFSSLYVSISKIENETRSLLYKIKGSTGKKTAATASKRLFDLRNKLRELRQEAYKIESKLVQNANLVACTAAKSAIAPEVYSRSFDSVLVDEASMMYLPYVFFAASLAKKRIGIFGDFMQIPPITQSSTRVLDILSRDIFREIGVRSALRKDEIAHLKILRRQYRMPKVLVDLINDRMYGGNLETVESKQASIIGDELLFYDTEALQPKCFHEAHSNSRANLLSALISFGAAFDALKRGAKTVGIITPYRAQVRLLKGALKSMKLDPAIISVATVHTFQGNERDVIVFDFVDDNPLPIGLLLHSSSPIQLDDVSQSERLLNVAITRAKKRLIFVGNFRYLEERADEDTLLRSVLTKIRTEKLIHPVELSSFGKNGLINNFPGLNFHDDFARGVLMLLRDVANSTENIRLIQPSSTKLQFFRYVLNPNIESSQEFKNLEMTTLQNNLKSVKLISSTKAPYFIWIIDDSIISVFDILNRQTPISFRIDNREVVSALLNILPHDSDKISADGYDASPYCPQCGGRLELAIVKGIYVARCSEAGCVSIPAGARMIEAILEEKGEECPICGGRLKIRRGKRGLFVGCSNYPTCTWTAEVSEILN